MRRLNEDHEMIHDKPSWHFGRELTYGSLQDDARRALTQDEIGWNRTFQADEMAAAAIRAKFLVSRFPEGSRPLETEF